MKHYLITITFNAPYPKTSSHTIVAGSFSTAISRAMKAWKAENKGRRVKELNIKVITL